MEKIYCDYCKKESQNTQKLIIPDKKPIEIRGGKGNVLLGKVGYKTINVQKDICPSCREKIATLLFNAKGYF